MVSPMSSSPTTLLDAKSVEEWINNDVDSLQKLKNDVLASSNHDKSMEQLLLDLANDVCRNILKVDPHDDSTKILISPTSFVTGILATKAFLATKQDENQQEQKSFKKTKLDKGHVANQISDCRDDVLVSHQREQHDIVLQRGKRIEAIVQKVVSAGILHENNPSIDLFNMDTYEQRLNELIEAFQGVTCVHGLAVKTQPMRGILKVATTKGLGAECASYPEAKHALQIGFEPRKILYDTPCKTTVELREMIQAGVYINLDNIEEINKVNMIMKEMNVDLNHSCHHGGPFYKQFGLRINPLVGSGVIESTSTATITSKFGLPYKKETENELLDIFVKNPWLQGVHCHVGSQGCAMQLLVNGAKRTTNLAELVNTKLNRDQIKVIDIGGGLPTIYNGLDKDAHSFHDYVAMLKEQVPMLFSGKYDILTEFGKCVFVKPGITLTRVEAIKTWCGQRIAIVHVGANQFVRTAYVPDQWKHCFSVFDSKGNVKDGASGPLLCQDIAGPMCFSGDFLGKQVYLPEIKVGDYIAIHDTGGCTTAMYSKFNSRRASAMYAYDNDCNLSVLKDRETCKETLAFWGHDEPKPIVI